MVVAAEDEQLARQRRGALGRARDLGHVLGRRMVVAERLGHEVGVVEDHGQQVVEVVRDAAGELAERVHPLCALESAP